MEMWMQRKEGWYWTMNQRMCAALKSYKSQGNRFSANSLYLEGTFKAPLANFRLLTSRAIRQSLSCLRPLKFVVICYQISRKRIHYWHSLFGQISFLIFLESFDMSFFSSMSLFIIHDDLKSLSVKPKIWSFSRIVSIDCFCFCVE